MTKKTRLIILFFCVVCFFVVAPILVAYSMGFRFDFEKMKVTATGGIYVRTFPTAEQITIDSNILEKPGLFANSIFVQSLLPKNHTVSIKKTGHYDYFKTLPVQEKEVTKLENVLLFKKNIAFSNLIDKVDYFSAAPNNQNIIIASYGTGIITFQYFSLDNADTLQKFSTAQTGTISDIKWSDDSNKILVSIQSFANTFYYFFDTTQTTPLQKQMATRLSYLDKNSQQISFNPQDSQTLFYIKNNTLYSAKGNSSLPIINNIISFKISGTNITWLSSMGALSSSDLSGKLIAKISLKNFPADSKKTYEIISISGDTFLKEGTALFKLDQNTKTFENFIIPAITDYKILTSSDGKNLIFGSSDKIYLYSFADNPSAGSGQRKFQEIFSGNKIANLQWLNNDYIVFTSGDKIIISEIDYRGNINAITLPQTAGSTFFNQRNGKLYVLSNNSLFASEKLTP